MREAALRRTVAQRFLVAPPRRVLHVLGSLQRGGAEMRTLELLRHVDRSRYALQFCTLSAAPGDLAGEARALGSTVHTLPLDFTFPWRFRKLLRTEQIDVVHSHVHYFSGFIVRLAARVGVPVRVVHFRNTHDGNGDGWMQKTRRAVFRRWIDRYATNILAVCEGAMRVAWQENWALDRRCRVAYNGLDTASYRGHPDPAAVRREFGLPGACPLYLHVGRFVAQKNHSRLIGMFAAIVARQPEARLLLVGLGGNEIERRIRERIRALQLSRHVVVAGQRADVPQLMLAADLLLLPSRWEGLPGVVLEACAAGTPVLATDLPGVREIAAHFPSVHALSLDDGDAIWADRAMTIARPPAPDEVNTAVHDFDQTIFNIKRSVDLLSQVWAAAAPAPHA